MKRFSVLFLVMMFVLGMSASAFAGTIDLSTWSQRGPLGNGNWSVASDGSSVYQSINGQPTYYVSSANYINTQFEGSFRVEQGGDDDFIGFVFGWNGIDDFYLFDWKQGNQSGAFEGFTVSKISGSDVDFWLHSGSDIDLLQTLYGSTLGWVTGATNNFVLDYTTNAFSITVNGNLIFTQLGNFATGQFGFYNYSQGGVRYQGFEEDVSPTAPPSAVPEPSTVVLLALGFAGIIGVRRFKK